MQIFIVAKIHRATEQQNSLSKTIAYVFRNVFISRIYSLVLFFYVFTQRIFATELTIIKINDAKSLPPSIVGENNRAICAV